MTLPADESGEKHNGLSQILNFHGHFDVFFVIDQFADQFDFVDDIFSMTVILPLFRDIGPQFLEDVCNLKGVNPFLKESGILIPEVGLGRVGRGQIWFHDAVHDHQVGLVEGSLVVAAVVERQADVDVVQTYLFVQVQVEDVEVYGQQHLYFFEEGEKVLFSNCLLLDLVPRVQAVAVLEDISQIQDR